ncbi:MAG: methyltransferase domain-containing protein [Dehalococcoidia bacterium]|nr:methyltransferase domain-containing protein [Dehalococcoidia bacterium]
MKAAAELDYIHGFSKDEQNRLYSQARFLEPMVFADVDFSGRRRVLEVGCGVGAQTQILLERFPGITVQAVDLSAAQVERASEHLREPIAAGRARVDLADATRLPFPDASFDAAFICWVLEHTPDPVAVLRELRRVLCPGAAVFGIEVMNTTFFLHPACPSTRAYWDALNRGQQAAGGDPFVGAKLGNLLKETGFAEVRTKPWFIHHDQRGRVALACKLDYWEPLLVSAAPQLLAAGLVDQALVDSMRRELRSLKTDPRAVFCYSPVKFSAVAE